MMTVRPEAVVAAIDATSAQLGREDPDIRLMLRVRDDEAGAFEELVKKYQHRLVAVMHHLIGDAEEAEDLGQEVFLRVYLARKRYQARSKLSTWLFTIAYNLANSVRRSRRCKPSVPLAGHLLRSRACQPDRGVQNQELADVIRRAIAGLNEQQRMAILLNKFEEMNYIEIAMAMKLSTKAVKSLLCRARANLRAALRDYVYMDREPILR